MAVIDNLMSGVGNFERVDRTLQWDEINRDASKHEDRVDGGLCPAV